MLVGVADLMIGILAIICFWFYEEFWLAAIIAITVFYLGGAFVHIHQMLVYQNYSIGNTGVRLYVNIAYPLILWLLYAAYKLTEKK